MLGYQEDAEDLYPALVWPLSLTAFAERAPRFLGRCHYRSQSMLKERARVPESVPPSLTAFAASASRVPRCLYRSRVFAEACEFTTSACLKHSRDGRAGVSITSACLKHFRDGKPCVFTTGVCLKHFTRRERLCIDHKCMIETHSRRESFSIHYKRMLDTLSRREDHTRVRSTRQMTRVLKKTCTDPLNGT